MLFVGLGNPGPEYSETRHNVGWMILDTFSDKIGAAFEPLAGMQAELAEKKYASRMLRLAKPMAYMNMSGRPVAQLLTRFEYTASDLIVIHDDLDLEPGRLKLQTSRGAGGHNGVEDIIDRLGTNAFARLRVGIGHPSKEDPDYGRDYVLSPFTAEETVLMKPAMKRAVAALKEIAKHGLTKAMNAVNRKERELIAESDNETETTS